MTGSETDYAEAKASVAREVSTDSYALKPAWYGEAGQADFLPPEVTAYVANALMFAFAGGLIATLQPAAALAGKTVGKWVSDKLQELLGSKERVKEASDEEVQKAIKELKDAAASGKLDKKATDEASAALASSLRDFGVTPARANEIVATVKGEVDKLVS